MGNLVPRLPDTTAQNKGPIILGVSYSISFLASLFVAGRLFWRRRKLGRWAADDYIILVSFVCHIPSPCPSPPIALDA